MADKIKSKCPGCAAVYSLSISSVGRNVKCPKCGEQFMVEVPQPSQTEVVDELQNALDDFESVVEPQSEEVAPATPPAGRSKRKSASARKGASAGGRRREPAAKKEKVNAEKGSNVGVMVGIGVVIVIAVVAFFMLSGGPSGEFKQAQKKIEVTGSTAEKVSQYLQMWQVAIKGDWSTAAADAKKAYSSAYGQAKKLEAKAESVDLLLGKVDFLVKAGEVKKARTWCELAVERAKKIDSASARWVVLRSLKNKLVGMTKIKGSAEMGERLTSTIFQTAKGMEVADRVKNLTSLANEISTSDKALAEKCWTTILASDKDNADAHQALGHVFVPKDDPIKEVQGKWLSSKHEIRIWQKKKEKIAVAKAQEDKQKERWTASRFAKRCRRLRDKMKEEIPTVKWKFYFDNKFIKPPYLLAVEESTSPTTESIAKNQGYALSGLVTNFYKRYNGLLELKKPDRPRGVYVFASKDTYRKFYEWDKKERDGSYPNPTGIGGFFSGNRERMYLWFKGNSGMDLTAVMFHEGTHQLMHYNKQSPGPNIGNSPWLQEGLAEFFGGYYSRYRPDGDGKQYRNGKFLKNRYGHLKAGAIHFKKTGEVRGLLKLKDMMNLGYSKFREYQWGRNRNRYVVSLIYAEGWAFIHFCNNYKKNGKKGYYRDKFEQFLAREVEGVTNGERFAQIFGLGTDKDWERLQKEFFDYLMDSDTGMRHFMYESQGRGVNFWPPED